MCIILNTDGKQFRCSVFTFVKCSTCKEKPWLNVDKIIAYLSQPTKWKYFLSDNYIWIAEFLPDYRVTKDLIFTVVFSRKSSTTPYHPLRNRMVESDNQNRLIMVGILEDKQKEKWKLFVTSLVHSFISTLHENTGYSLIFLWGTLKTCYECIFIYEPRQIVRCLIGLLLYHNPAWQHWLFTNSLWGTLKTCYECIFIYEPRHMISNNVAFKHE